MSIQVEIIGAEMEDVYRMFSMIEFRLSAPMAMFFLAHTMEPWLRDRAEARFDAEGDDAAGRWQALHPTTEHFRQSQGFPASHPINHRTGELERYITQEPGRTAGVAGGVQLTFPGTPPGSKWLTQKLETAQRGRSYPSTPARPVLAVSWADMNFYMSVLAHYIENGP